MFIESRAQSRFTPCRSGGRRCVGLMIFVFGLWAQSAGAAPPRSRSVGPLAEKSDLGIEQDAASREVVQTLALNIAEQTVVPAKGVRSYSEGTRGIVDVRLTRNGEQFVLVGEEAGSTTLLFIMMDGSEKHLLIEVKDPKAKKGRVGLEVSRQDNIRLDFYFVQVDRANHHQIGVGYPQSVNLGSASASFDFLSQSFQSATAVVEDQALLRLDMAQAKGWAKLMRKAAVITENGMRAEFSGGGEVNIPVEGSLTTGIHTITYGSRIEVLPRYDSESGRLEIELSADVSDLSDDRGSGAPGRITSSISTIVNLELGQALVLAGLSSASKVKSNSGVPFLSQIPIFGLLFGSQRMSQQAADNVIFIVPTVVDATTSDAREQVRAAFEAYKKYSGGEKEREIVRKTWSRQ